MHICYNIRDAKNSKRNREVLLMKFKNILLITLLFLLMAVPTLAYSGEHKVAVNPGGFLLGILGAEYEGKLSNSNSYLLSLDYVGFSSGSDSLHVFGFGGGTRYYPQGQALQGFYVEGGTNLAYVSLNEADVKGTGLAIGLNGAGGYQWITRNNLTIERLSSNLYRYHRYRWI